MKLIRRELWKVIADYPDYEVSNHGRVRRATVGRRTWPGRILKPILVTNYPVVYIKGLLKKTKRFNLTQIHNMVLETFIGPRPENYECNHKDGNKQNNYYQNLEWVTHSENIKHAYRIGLKATKLTQKQADEIRELYKPFKMSAHKVGERYGVSHTSVFKIAKNKRWVKY